MSHQNHIKQMLINLNRRLQKLKEKQALYGLDTPIAILTEIEEIEIEIETLQVELENLYDDKEAFNLETNFSPDQNLCTELAQQIVKEILLLQSKLIQKSVFDFDRDISTIVNSNSYLTSLIIQYRQINCKQISLSYLSSIREQIRTQENKLAFLQAQRYSFGIEAPPEILKQVRLVELSIKLNEFALQILTDSF